MPGRARGSGAVLLVLIAMSCGAAGCAPASERPVRGAHPGTDSALRPPGVPPTLSPSEALRLRPQPPPVLVASPSPAASPSAVVAPPIVRTINPSADGRLPAGAPVTLSAVLVGRGADLASATLTVNGADPGARIEKRTSREWSIHASQALDSGTHTARVLVRDTAGGAGGFTWKFSVGEVEEPSAMPDPTAARP